MLDQIKHIKSTLMEKLNFSDTTVNIDNMARSQSLITGAGLLYSGITDMKTHPKISIAKSVLGGYLIYRALTGHCHMNQMLERNTSNQLK